MHDASCWISLKRCLLIMAMMIMVMLGEVMDMSCPSWVASNSYESKDIMHLYEEH